MDDCTPRIADFVAQLRSCCQRLETSCATLRASVNHPSSSLPPPDSPSLLTTLVDRISSTSQAVRNLESKSTEVVSFQELLGHSIEIFKQNEAGIDAIEERLKQYGYIPVDVSTTHNSEEELVKSGDQSEERAEQAVTKLRTACNLDEMITPLHETKESLYTVDHIKERLNSCTYEAAEEAVNFDSIYTGTLNVEDLGLSAAGLACLAEEDSSPSIGYQQACSMRFEPDYSPKESTHSPNLSVDKDEQTDMTLPGDNVPFFMPVNEHEYSSCPTWLKMQISFEDLNEITGRMYDVVVNKESNSQSMLNQEDIVALNAGSKMKPCLLMLVKLGRIRTGHENGATVYHVVPT